MIPRETDLIQMLMELKPGSTFMVYDPSLQSKLRREHGADFSIDASGTYHSSFGSRDWPVFTKNPKP